MNVLPDLKPVSEFADVLKPASYVAVPDDWLVAVSDVVSSTAAIAAGQYKDVNLAGAATIAGIVNVSGEQDLPFAFGGDGAAVLLPPQFRDQAVESLRGTQTMCAEVMNLTLRCALVPMRAIRERGRDVRVAAHDLGAGRTLAMLTGGGIDLAESLCKSPEGKEFSVPPAAAAEPDLSGLSCRWLPLKPERGQMLSLVLRAREANETLPAIYRELYDAIARAAGPASPVSNRTLRMSWPPRGLVREPQLQGREGRLKRGFSTFVQGTVAALSLALKRPLAGFDATAYRDSLSRHSDYRKFADSLRMVIDCTTAEADAVEMLLEEAWRAGAVDYGTHRAGSALMTCFVHSTDDTGHIHFVDGADGGYALAAANMKRRIAEGR